MQICQTGNFSLSDLTQCVLDAAKNAFLVKYTKAKLLQLPVNISAIAADTLLLLSKTNSEKGHNQATFDLMKLGQL